MLYRKYKAKTFQEAKLKMLLDIGNRGYIVSQKKIKEGGFFGLFGKPMIELTAGIMEPLPEKNPLPNPDPLYVNRMDPDLSVKSKNNRPKSQMEQLIQVKGRVPEEDDNQSLRTELDEIKSLISKIISDKTTSLEQKENIQSRFNQFQQHEIEEIKKTKDLLKMFLKEEDFNESFIETLCSLSSVEMILAKEKDISHLKDRIKNQISEIIHTSNGIEIENNSQNIIVLVGPTGVGKTTSLAKLGAYFGVFQKKKVKLISIDTYRVGAIQQLKLYADIMEIPFAKVNNVEELKMELHDKSFDIILIDTTGRSQKNLDEIRDIKKYLDVINGKSFISLVISATTKYKDLVEILDKFDILNYNNIIVTKLDETNSLGQVISAISPKNRTLSYVTFGQSVPEDIEEATKDKLMNMVLKAK